MERYFHSDEINKHLKNDSSSSGLQINIIKKTNE